MRTNGTNQTHATIHDPPLAGNRHQIVGYTLDRDASPYEPLATTLGQDTARLRANDSDHMAELIRKQGTATWKLTADPSCDLAGTDCCCTRCTNFIEPLSTLACISEGHLKTQARTWTMKGAPLQYVMRAHVFMGSLLPEVFVLQGNGVPITVNCMMDGNAVCESSSRPAHTPGRLRTTPNLVCHTVAL